MKKCAQSSAKHGGKGTLISATNLTLAMLYIASHLIDINNGYNQCFFFLMAHITSPLFSKNKNCYSNYMTSILEKQSHTNQHIMSSVENT
jgi:hypothetical protein